MSIQATKEILQDFLCNENYDVLALTGAWGTGKTYAWKEALTANKGDLKFKHYCYISLFGISTMAELRMALFTKTRAVENLDKELDFDRLNSNWRSIATDGFKGLFARFAPILRNLPYGSSVSLGLEAIAPGAVSDTLVCLDDFERQTSIRVEEVLGLITELSEERRCKVALIFNAEKFIGKDTYQVYREKVIDFELRYAPTVQEAFGLVFDAEFPNRDLVLHHVVDLDITNVRILRKLRQLIKRIAVVTDGMHTDVIEATITTTVLLCWCAYAPEESKPKVADIEKWNKDLMSFKKETDQEPATLAWVRRLQAYGFSHVDDLDLAIARVVEHGYVEGTGFAEVAKRVDTERRNEVKSKRFSAIWRDFHDSFSGEPEAFTVELYDAAVYAIAQISSGDLNGTVRLLRELKRDDLADDLIEKFVEANKERPPIFDLKEHPFGGSIDDPKLRTKFDAVHAGLTHLPGLTEAITFIVKNSGYNADHLEAMKKASVEDYEAMFLAPHDSVELSSLIKWSLRWADSDHAEITTKAKEALNRIKAINLLNRIRVGRYGV